MKFFGTFSLPSLIALSAVATAAEVLRAAPQGPLQGILAPGLAQPNRYTYNTNNLDNPLNLPHVPHQAIQCRDVFARLQTRGRVWNTPSARAAYTIFNAITGALHRVHPEVNVDKVVVRALSILQSHNQRSSSLLSYSDLKQLMTCVLDQKGHTMLMRIVELGLEETLRHPVVFHLRAPQRLDEMVDVDGNNLIHLAVKSRNDAVLREILDYVQHGPDPEAIPRLLETHNKAGYTPEDLALAMNLSNIVKILRSYHIVFVYARAIDTAGYPGSSEESHSAGSESRGGDLSETKAVGDTPAESKITEAVQVTPSESSQSAEGQLELPTITAEETNLQQPSAPVIDSGPPLPAKIPQPPPSVEDVQPPIDKSDTLAQNPIDAVEPLLPEAQHESPPLDDSGLVVNSASPLKAPELSQIGSSGAGADSLADPAETERGD